MKVRNPLFIKDWKIKDLISLIVTVQIIYFLLVILDNIGLHIPIITELIGSFIMLVIPGTLLLRLLNLDVESNGQILLYTLGTSVFLLMLIGFLMNTTYPLLGFNQPLSSQSIIATITIFIFSFSFILYLVEKFKDHQLILEGSSPQDKPVKKIDLSNLPSAAPQLILVSIPILSILGAYAMNVYQSNILSMLIIVLIGILALLIGMSRFPTRLYPLAIFSISISLLLHMSLITNYIWGWDINSEYFLANQIASNAFWNVSLSSNYNSMLSVVILAPILTSYIKMNLVWIMKIIYPVLFSLVPLGLYYVYNKQTCPKIAFYATFFFMILFTFYTEMLSLVRQEVAELFLVLLLMVLISDNLNKTNKSFLSVIFGLSIVVSHYGLSYLMMIIFILSMVILYIINKNSFKFSSIHLPKIFNLNTEVGVTQSISGHNSGLDGVNVSSEPLDSLIAEKIRKYRPPKYFRLVITPSFIALFILLIMIWYFYTSNSSILQSFLGIGQNIIGNLYNIMDPNSSQGLSLVIQGQVTPLKNVHKYFYLISQFFILVGILAMFLGKDGMKFNSEYRALSYGTFIILVVGLFLPFFSSQMNTSRLYHIALIILAPFCIIGIVKIIHKFKTLPFFNLNQNHYIQMITIFLIIFMFFDTGLIYAVTDQSQCTSIALNPSTDFPKFNDREVTAGNWLANNIKANTTVYADQYRTSVLRSMIPVTKEIPGQFDPTEACSKCNKSNVFLGTWNINKNQILAVQWVGANVVASQNYVSPEEILKNRSKIYDNGGAYIYGAITP